MDFWNIGKVSLPANPTPFVSFSQKNLTVNPSKKKNFCVLCVKLPSSGGGGGGGCGDEGGSGKGSCGGGFRG